LEYELSTSRIEQLRLCSLLLIAIATSSQAGSVTNGIRTPAGCGVKPEAPVVDAKNEKTYNLSVAAANAYLENIRAFIDCQAQEANVDINGIAQAANAAQQAASEVRQKLLADVKAGADKLSK
jgi:hypothetical protein